MTTSFDATPAAETDTDTAAGAQDPRAARTGGPTPDAALLHAAERAAHPSPPRMALREKLVLLVLCAATVTVAMDFSILNVALPTIGRSLRIPEADLQWVATAFALPSGGLLLLFGRLGDLAGRRRLFLGGLAVFTLASLLAALAWNPAALLAARAVQGLGAAGVVPSGMALLTTSFPEGPRRERALGVNGALAAFGFTAGTVLGGVLTQELGWRSTMALNVLLGTAVLAAAPTLIRESRGAARPRLDLPGAAAVTGGLLALIYALTAAAQSGWTRPPVLAALGAGLAALAAFAAIEARTTDPLVSLRVLGRRTVSGGNLGGLATLAGASAFVFLSTLYLQQVKGMTPATAGLVTGYVGLVCALTGIAAPRLIGRLGAARVLVAALALQAVSTAAMCLLTRGDAVAVIMAAGTFLGIAHLSSVVAYAVTATSGLPDREQGLAAGLVTTAQQVGLTVGIPLFGALAAARAGTLEHAGRAVPDALAAGIRLGLGADAAFLALAAALLAPVLLRTARHAARTQDDDAVRDA